MIHFHVVTLFGDIIDSYIKESIIARAIKNKLVKVTVYNIRDFAKGELMKKWPDGNVTTYVDGRPYGGGPGMVLRAEPILGAISKIENSIKKKSTKKPTIILTTPSGKEFNNVEADKLSKQKDIVIICGRYEGIDARVSKITKSRDYSVGPYTLTGGELPALIMIDAISRRIKGVLNKEESLEENRVSSSEVYTRPEVLEYNGKKLKVPKILLSGHKAKIDEWKQRGN
jgi:tRNA (guanine37-N1)-methyltransferase